MAGERNQRGGPGGAGGPGGQCPNCGADLGGVVGRDQGRDVDRATCPACALQLVRRGGGPWEGIRG